VSVSENSMARVVGTSGAWKQVTAAVAELGISCSHPQEIRLALDEMKATYGQRTAQFYVQVDNEISALKDGLPKLTEQVRSRIEAESALVADQTERLDASIAELRLERRIWRRLGNYFRIRSRQRLKETLQTDLLQFINKANERVSQCQQQIQNTTENRSQIVQDRKHRLDTTISRLATILASTELAGACVELEIAEVLSRLPTECWVFHDVRLEADHFMRFEGVPLQSAQLDHVALTANGVFVIEAKNWSRGFVEAHNFFDPFTQVGRGRFLCQALLRERGYETKVRGIVATRSKLPGKRDDQFVKVLGPRELNGYILWFKSAPMTIVEINGIRDFFESRVALA
jgi:hypothetical protein